MADYLTFNDGAALILDTGIQGPIEWALSTKSVETSGSMFAAGDKLSGGIGEITGTGYGRKKQTAPKAAGRVKNFTQMEWRTEAAANWPPSVKSIVLIKGLVAVAAWDLRATGAVRNLSAPNTIERVAPSLTMNG